MIEPKVDFKQLTSKEEILEHYKFIKQVPLTDSDSGTVLANCLLGHFITYSFILNDEPVGVLVCHAQGPTMFIVGHYAKGTFKLFDRDLYYSNLKKAGFERVRCASLIDPAKVEAWSGMKRIYSVFEKEL